MPDNNRVVQVTLNLAIHKDCTSTAEELAAWLTTWVLHNVPQQEVEGVLGYSGREL